MGIGVVGIQTSQKMEQSGPPFTSGSANNGLSVDSATGRIVLGNNVGAAGAPAQLLSNREIFTDNGLALFRILLNSPTTQIITTLDGTQILITGLANTAPLMEVRGGNDSTPLARVIGGLTSTPEIIIQADTGGTANLTTRVVGNIWQVQNKGNGEFDIATSDFGVAGAVMRFYSPAQQLQIGGTLVAANGADVQLTGTATYRRFNSSTAGPTYNVNRDLDSGKLFRNSAAVNFVLPSMAGALIRNGFIFRVNVASATGVTVTADGADVIRFGSISTVLGGTLTSTDVGACVTCTYFAGVWITECFTGAWVVT